MPRKAREKSVCGIYHIMLRGVNRQQIFLDDEDREQFIRTVRRYKGAGRFEIYAYCLMGNHVHLLLKELSETISVKKKAPSSGGRHRSE